MLSQQSFLATPEELAEYRQLQADVRRIISNTHMPVVNLFAFNVTPFFIGQLFVLMDYLNINVVPWLIDSFVDMIHKAENMMDAATEQAFREHIIAILKSNIAKEKFHTLANTEVSQQFFHYLNVMHDACAKDLFSKINS